jgi:hypothetical protein
MRIRVLTVCLTLFALASSSPAWAGQHIADRTAQQQAIAQKDARDAAARQTIVTAIQRPDVKALAGKMGVDLAAAESAAKTLPADQANELAQQLLGVDPDLAGGVNTITISLTTLLLVIIIIVLIAD